MFHVDLRAYSTVQDALGVVGTPTMIRAVCCGAGVAEAEGAWVVTGGGGVAAPVMLRMMAWPGAVALAGVEAGAPAVGVEFVGVGAPVTGVAACRSGSRTAASASGTEGCKMQRSN